VLKNAEFDADFKSVEKSVKSRSWTRYQYPSADPPNINSKPFFLFYLKQEFLAVQIIVGVIC
jgi:hypothetical protein